VTSLHNPSFRSSSSLLWVGAVLAVTGCSTSTTQLREQRPAGVWQVRLPESTGPYGLRPAGGATGVARGAPQPAADIDAFLQPQHLRAGTAHVPAVSTPRAARRMPDTAVAAKPAPAPTPSAPVLAAAAPTESVAAQGAPRADELERYAQRDVRAQHAKAFRGGDAVVISVGTLLVVLLIVLLVVLLVR
jgi:hypothetical protein